MTASDRLLKKNQSNFLLSNFREFYKLWRDNQEAILTVKCCDGKLSINFESSFRSPETKPTLETSERNIKRISPSRRRRNQARAEQFRRNKASKENADEVPASSKEGQKETQSSVSSRESALENPPSATAVLGKGPSDPTDDAENQNSLPVSRVKRKAKRRQDERKNATVNEEPEATVETLELSAADVESRVLEGRSQRYDEPDHDRKVLTPPSRQCTREAVELWRRQRQLLDSTLDSLEQKVKDDRDDPELCEQLFTVSGLIKKFGDGNFPEDIEDECFRASLSLERRIQCLTQRFQQPRARASSVSSYKGRASAKTLKGRKR